MPEGPFGLPRITDFGPFAEVDVDRTEIEIVEKEEIGLTPPDARDILPRESNRVIIEAIYDSRGGREPSGSKEVGDIIGLGDFIFKRQAGSTSFNYKGQKAWSGRTEVKDEFRRAGLGSELFLQKLDGMRSRGVKQVWARGVTTAGRNILEKHGFRLINEERHAYFRELQ